MLVDYLRLIYSNWDPRVFNVKSSGAMLELAIELKVPLDLLLSSFYFSFLLCISLFSFYLTLFILFLLSSFICSDLGDFEGAKIVGAHGQVEGV